MPSRSSPPFCLFAVSLAIVSAIQSLAQLPAPVPASPPPPAPVTITNAPPALSTPPIFRDPERPLSERVADLIGHLTMDEKISLLCTESNAVPRLEIPEYSWRSEGIHGIARDGPATMFPQCIAMAATWNTGLVWRIGNAISDEARVKYRQAPSARCQGLTYWAPVVDLTRDPRWGRTMETYGEDPWLVSQCALAYIRGMQGDDPRYMKVATTVKHFAVHGQETDRLSVCLPVSERMLREYYLLPFQITLNEGRAASVMTCHTGVNGFPSSANAWLLTDILQKEWHFDGPVITDMAAFRYMVTTHKYFKNDEESLAASIAAGVHIQTIGRNGIITNMFNVLQSGQVKESQLDESLRRVLTLRFRLGMFDPPDRIPWNKLPDSTIGCPEHVELTREVSRQSLVLLKNGPVPRRSDPAPLLPLNRQKLESIAVLGYYANYIENGTYESPPLQPAVTLLRGIQDHVGNHVVVRTVPWFDATGKKRTPVEAAVKAAALSDVAVVAVGLNRGNEYEGKDRLDLNLPKEHQELVEDVVAANPATVVVLINGAPLAVNWIQERVPAILEAWYPGEQGGNAIADALFGDCNPAGRLPLTFFASMNQLPYLNECEITRGRTYMYFKDKPLYPFGYGLSYTRFEYGNLRLDRDKAGTNDTVNASIDVKNTGDRDGDEVVQLYIRQPDTKVPMPIKQLRAFSRTSVARGQTQTVQLPVRIGSLGYWNEEYRRWVIEPGAYEVQVGASSADIRARATFRVE
jgi:beta-glucosidase